MSVATVVTMGYAPTVGTVAYVTRLGYGAQWLDNVDEEADGDWSSEGEAADDWTPESAVSDGWTAE